MKRIDRGDSAVEKGFTLIEILIALALMSLVTTAIYSFYISQYKTWISQDLITEMQQNGRVAIDTISRDLLQTGYGTTVAIEEGNQNRIAVLYKDPDPTVNRYTRVMYWKSPQNELKRYEKNGATVTALGTINWSIGGTTLGEDVTSLEFAYFDKNGNMTVTPQSSPNEPYRVKVTIKLQTSRDDPLKPGTRKHFTLSTDIRPRNIGITGIASDTNPPAPPTGLQVVDPGVCGTLWVKWTPNTEADLASYTIYYGQATGVYTATASVSKTGMDNNPVGEYYPLTGLTTSASDGSSTVTYYIKVVAVDTSGNASILELSTEVSGNPPVSLRAFPGNDSTINIAKPAIATNFNGSNGGTDNRVILSWTKSTDPNVVGYRLYRMEKTAYDALTYPVVPNSTTIVMVADKDTLGPDKETFTDTSAADTPSDISGLVGCKTYYYVLEAVPCDGKLVSKEGSDGADTTKYYTSSDYAVTYGDGTTGVPASSDTTPADGVGIGASDPDYAYPSLTARPGWKRASLTLTNPNLAADQDFSHTFIAFKRLRTDTVCTPLSVCYPSGIAADGTVTGGTLVPDKNITDGSAVIDGKFTQEGGGNGNNFFFDSEGVQYPGTPTLENVCAIVDGNNIPCTYYFTAVAFDRCGNPSQITAAAQPFSTLCGDDATALGSPGVPTGFTVKGCTDMQLSWNDQSGIIDFAGYTVSSDTDSSLSGATILTNATDYPLAGVTNYPNPYWPDNADCPWGCGKPYYEDLTAAEGGVYYYFVRAMDCAYANDPLGDSNGDGALIEFSSNISSEAVQGPVYPGMIDRDGGAVAVVTDHQEILTLDSRGDVTSDPTMGYHNRVKLYLRNTSAGVMTITGIPDIRWGKTSARLAKVLIGGFEYAGNNNTTTQTTVWQAGSAAQLLGTCTSTPSDLCTASVTFSTPMVIGASDLHVPIIFEFRDAANAVNENADMTGDSAFRMTLDVTNNSTNTTGCETYLTTNRQDAAIPVPFGPVMSGTVQNRTGTDYPSSSTVPGYWYLGVGLNVNVITNVSDTSGAGISSVKLYYAVTERTVASAPTSFGDYTPITMSLVSGQYKTSSPIPSQSNKRIWYYIIAKDTQGNFDREPAVQNGFYTYDQPPLDPCSVTPSTPNPLTLGTWLTDGSLLVKWPVVTQYTDGGTIDKTVDKITYQIWRRTTLGGTFQKLYDGLYAKDNGTYSCGWQYLGDLDGAGPSTDHYIRPCSDNYEFFDSDDSVLVKNFDLTYYIVAKNSCSATGNTSSPTNQYSECWGPAGTSASISVSPSTINAAESYTVTVNDCAKSGGTAGEQITINNVASTGGSYSVILTENAGNTGVFTGTIQTTRSSTEAGKLQVTPDDLNPATVTVSCTSGCSGTPPSATLTVNAAPCDYDPATPTAFALNQGSDKSARFVTLSWAASSIPDVVGYNAYSKKSTEPDTSWVIASGCTPRSRTTTSCTAGTSDGEKLSSAVYMWRLKALDSCNKESVPTSAVTETCLTSGCP